MSIGSPENSRGSPSGSPRSWFLSPIPIPICRQPDRPTVTAAAAAAPTGAVALTERRALVLGIDRRCVAASATRRRAGSGGLRGGFGRRACRSCHPSCCRTRWRRCPGHRTRAGIAGRSAARGAARPRAPRLRQARSPPPPARRGHRRRTSSSEARFERTARRGFSSGVGVRSSDAGGRRRSGWRTWPSWPWSPWGLAVCRCRRRSRRRDRTRRRGSRRRDLPCATGVTPLMPMAPAMAWSCSRSLPSSIERSSCCSAMGCDSLGRGDH